MIERIGKNWGWLALCGVLEAIISVLYFNHSAHGFHALKDMLFLGRISLAAGACAIAAGVWRPEKGARWPLVLNGLALGALGLLLNGIAGFRISLRTIALLTILTALSIGILEFRTARTLRRQHRTAEHWFFSLAGAGSIGFASVFLASGLGWMKTARGSLSELLWFGAYFGFTAICMLGLALRLRSSGLSRSGQPQGSLPFGHPKHAH